MFRPITGTVCILCNRSVLRRRTYVLTQDLHNRFRAIVDVIIQRIYPRQIIFNSRERVCVSCWAVMRAQRFQFEVAEHAVPARFGMPTETRVTALRNICT